MAPLVAFAVGLVARDALAWGQRMTQRERYYVAADALCKARNKPLLIVGRPKGWSVDEGAAMVRHGCGCPSRGDIVVDLVAAPECPQNGVVADVEDLSRWRDGFFGAAYVSCVLEHVDDIHRAWREIHRVVAPMPGRPRPVFVVYPQPWSGFARACDAHRWVITSREGELLRAERIVR